MNELGFTDKKMLTMLQHAIDADEKSGHNAWGGQYTGDEKPPTLVKRYWDQPHGSPY